MALPAGITTITVTGYYTTIGGASLGGAVAFSPSSQLTDAAGNVVFGLDPVVAPVNAQGQFLVTLPCTDNAGLTPAGWSYTVEVAVPGIDPKPFTILLPSSLGPSVQLSALEPAS